MSSSAGLTLLVKLSKLLQHRGHVAHPLLHLGRASSPGEVSEQPGPGLSLTVDVGQHGLPLSTYYQLGVVLEVVHLKQDNVSK